MQMNQNHFFLIYSFRYGAVENYDVQLRQLTALAFRKEEDVRDSYVELKATPFFQENNLGELLEYFEYTWIGKPPNQNPENDDEEQEEWTDPLFPIEMWNVFDAVTHDWARTNNDVEGWHSRFSRVVQGRHLNIFKFIEKLISEEDHFRIEIARVAAGGPVPAKKPQYIRLDNRLRNLVQEYDEREVLQYLRAVAHNLAF